MAIHFDFNAGQKATFDLQDFPSYYDSLSLEDCMMFIHDFLIVHLVSSIGSEIHLANDLLESRCREFLTIVDAVLRRISAGLFFSFLFE